MGDGLGEEFRGKRIRLFGNPVLQIVQGIAQVLPMQARVTEGIHVVSFNIDLMAAVQRWEEYDVFIFIHFMG